MKTRILLIVILNGLVLTMLGILLLSLATNETLKEIGRACVYIALLQYITITVPILLVMRKRKAKQEGQTNNDQNSATDSTNNN